MILTRALNLGNLSLLEDRVMVRMNDRQAVSRGGIIIPEKAREQSREGTVLSTGPECADVGAGDVVGVPVASGTKMIVGGEEVVILREPQVLYLRAE